MQLSPITRTKGLRNNEIIALRQDCRKQKRSKPAVTTWSEEDVAPEDGIFCRACGEMVTSRKEIISVSGTHAHTFFNPAGIVFEVGCFKAARGCIVVGEPTTEFTWFAGHVWSYALCRGCQNHLGWFFEGRDSSFFGLILPRLRE